MTKSFTDTWEVKDSECMEQEFEHYFYSKDPSVYSIEGSHATFTGVLSTESE